MLDVLIVMRYDDWSGIDIKASFPEGKLQTSERTLMHIFNLHEFSNEPGIASLTIEKTNFVTYYSGSQTDYFFILILNILENPEDYEEILEEVSKTILKNLKKNKYYEMLPSLYNQIIEYPKKKIFQEKWFKTNSSTIIILFSMKSDNNK